jgi:hypothetical protein
LDQVYVPRQGLRFAGSWETGGLDRHTATAWIALGLPQQYSLWLQSEQSHSPQTAYYLWYSPERELLPFGFMSAEGQTQTYTYSRLSLVRPLFWGISGEIAVDTYDGNGQTTGFGSFLHYPLDIGCISVGYGTNAHNGIFIFNLAKQI